jgi:hypothetical protein
MRAAEEWTRASGYPKLTLNVFEAISARGRSTSASATRSRPSAYVKILD